MTVASTARRGAESAQETSEFWNRPGLDDVYFFKARFLNHAYSRHTHARHAIGATESGTQVYWCAGADWLAGPGSLSFINPEDSHDGRSAGGWYSYRMLYVGPGNFARALGEESVAVLPLFRAPAVQDPALAAELLDFHRSAEEAISALEAESRLLSLLLALTQRHAGSAPRGGEPMQQSKLVRRVCDYLHAHLGDDPSLSDLVAITGVTRFHLLRQFTREVGMPPHQYLTQRRLRHAQRLLQAGEPAASVAAAVGFTDQSHLIKRFRAAYGMTPGQFIRGMC